MSTQTIASIELAAETLRDITMTGSIERHALNCLLDHISAVSRETPVTDAPYSAAWREHARARLFRLGVSVDAVATRTGLGGLAGDALLGSGPVSLEVCGPVDELLEQLEAGCGRRTARRMRPASVEVGPVLADLGPLTNCDVVLVVKP